MSCAKNQLVEALNASVEDLQQGFDRHCCLIASMLAEDSNEQQMKRFIELWPHKSRERQLKEAIKNAIDVLEESRKAFKSKQLEYLRKELMQVLIDAD